MRNKKKSVEFVMLSETYSADLRGRQSVRTTFKLPPRSIDALSLLASQLGIKQKSIFDHLVDDTRALQELARDLENRAELDRERVPKTYVISRKTLENLEQVCKRYQAPRDALVEFCIERIMPLIKEEKEKHLNRQKLQTKLDQYLALSRELLEDADKELDRDDPVFEQVYLMARTAQSGYDEINQIIEKGARLEDY
ncbi:MAG: hypothetical protein HKP52_10190 [Desulfofustis sp.]|nr:hypothetical protein [Desulfofustis sp.]MBT8345698.1 hypothetical protein [Desulfofustis sp.]MBT8355272.1 hypothetical protein [Desulfofustis sp.]NNK14596.1 hypothetical protein [Desulfofustis sp.]NNK57096.1 hypothetical protein [Desulfofustis sp.]